MLEGQKNQLCQFFLMLLKSDLHSPPFDSIRISKLIRIKFSKNTGSKPLSKKSARAFGARWCRAISGPQKGELCKRLLFMENFLSFKTFAQFLQNNSVLHASPKRLALDPELRRDIVVALVAQDVAELQG